MEKFEIKRYTCLLSLGNNIDISGNQLLFSSQFLEFAEKQAITQGQKTLKTTQGKYLVIGKTTECIITASEKLETIVKITTPKLCISVAAQNNKNV